MIPLMPKATRNPYFEEARLGAEEAARDLETRLRWEGPQDSSADGQRQIAERWIQERVPFMGVSVENSSGLSPVLRRARAAGIQVVTWDADADVDARNFTVVPAASEAVAQALLFEVARMLGGKGRFAAITSSLGASNQGAWIAQFRERLAREQPGLELAAIRPCGDDRNEAIVQVTELLGSDPRIQVIVGFCAPAVPGAAEAVRRSGRSGIRITGVSLPSLCKPYIEQGQVESIVAWSAWKLGYLAAFASHAVGTGVLQPGASTLRAGRLGNVVVTGDQIRLGRPHLLSKGNIEQFVSGVGRA